MTRSSNPRLNRPSNVLLVEDDANDVELTRQGFLRSEYEVVLHHVPNGQECIEYLHHCGKDTKWPTPDLILLDLNMPVMDGRDVLLAISQDVELRALPVVVLTTSSAQTDILFSYQMGCNAFIVKPVDFKDFQKAINTLCAFWFDTVRLTTGPPLSPPG